MPGMILRRAALLSIVLLCAVVESPSAVRAAQSKPPDTMHGFYRYKVRGLTAGAGLFSAMVFKAPGMYAATVSRVVPGFFKILSGMAKLSNDPSTKEMHDFLRSGSSWDLSGVPITAGYGVEIEFTLELVNKEWQLKRGSYRWSSDHHFSVSAGEGSIVENVRGQGSGPLDPKTSSITLTTTGKKGDLRQELAGDIDITSGFTAGKSVFTNGPIRWAFDHGTGEMQIVLPGLASVRERLVEPGENMSFGHISFSKGGPPEKVLKGMDVYQDLLDSGVVEEWELWDECKGVIESPHYQEEWVYNLEKPGRLIDTAIATGFPSFWSDELRWLLPEIPGSDLDPVREKANGDSVDIVYTNLPEKNSSFAFWQIGAGFSNRAKAAGCEDPEPTVVGYFFRRDGVNHGGPPGFKSGSNPDQKTPNPNWFHYWMQTKANAGLPTHFVRYGGLDQDCLDAHGYYYPGADHIVLCDLSRHKFKGYNPLVPGFVPKGIDWVAQIVLHERQHFYDYNNREWWPKGHLPGLDKDPVDSVGTGRTFPGDDIPDWLEPSLSPPPEVKARRGAKFDPTMQDSFGWGVEDEHYFPWAAALRWRMGSVNKEDWACPGKQGRSECRER